jgi:hypothetical protein
MSRTIIGLAAAAATAALVFTLGCGSGQDDSEASAPTTAAIWAGEEMPSQLSQTGLFADLSGLGPADGVIGYEVAFPLWSDEAEKHRHVHVPDGAKIEVDDDGRFVMPDGTWFAKSFGYREEGTLRKVETRVMRKADDTWTYVTYRWNEDGTEAELTEGQDVELDFCVPNSEKNYVIPGRIACLQCHAGSPVSGFHPWQLDEKLLTRLESEGHLATPAAEIPNRVVQGESAEEVAAIGYLASNCAHCHNPESSNYEGDQLDLRHHLAKEELVAKESVRLKRDDITTLVVPGNPGHSVLMRLFDAELGDREQSKMPPIGNLTIDPRGRAILTAWINKLEG